MKELSWTTGLATDAALPPKHARAGVWGCLLCMPCDLRCVRQCVGGQQQEQQVRGDERETCQPQTLCPPALWVKVVKSPSPVEMLVAFGSTRCGREHRRLVSSCDRGCSHEVERLEAEKQPNPTSATKPCMLGGAKTPKTVHWPSVGGHQADFAAGPAKLQTAGIQLAEASTDKVFHRLASSCCCCGQKSIASPLFSKNFLVIFADSSV